METISVLTGMLKDKDEYLIVKRSETDDFYPGNWEFPGGHLEDGETLKEGLSRELKEEINFDLLINPVLTHYYDEIKNENNHCIHVIELDFIINVDKKDLNIKLSSEHSDFKWVKKDSQLLDEYIKDKFSNINN